ncbi:hypothetical protein FJU54_13480 [Acinetobacter baumannii]|uniref:hypothetical protein n=1 Tax=Acinetobacter baumannii TaxID=470 RepID=UPI00112B730A|nr:hypothetical protein [Acinetobacter baumannii]TPT98425.1 hypothetical protein FJU54_13480 [Acinetobacter baumannii]
MKPERFIKRYGINEAKKIIDKAPNGTTHIHSVTWQNYKQGDSNNYVWGRSGREGWYLSIYETLNGMMVLEEIKRLVESVDLVESWGGIDDVKLYDLSHCKNRPESAGYKLLQAIADYESIYGGGDE